MVEFVRTFSVDYHVLPQLLKQREKYSGHVCRERYDPATIKKQLDLRIVGQEKDNSILVAWNDASPSGTAGHRVTYFGLFDPTHHHLKLLFIHDKKVSVTGASVNQERNLLAFTVMEPYFCSVDESCSLNITGMIYKSFLAEIRPQHCIFSLNIERHSYQRVQFLCGDYHGFGSISKKESHMLFVHHQEAIGLYHIPLARFGDSGMMISGHPRTEQVVGEFLWAQWDCQKQQLFVVYPEEQVKTLSKSTIGIYLHKFTNSEEEISILQKALPSVDVEAEDEEKDSQTSFIFAAYQFNEKSSFVRVLQFPLPFPDMDLTVKTIYPQYFDVALTQTVSERYLNMQVVSLPGRGSFFVCLQHPIPEDVEANSVTLEGSSSVDSTTVRMKLEYSVYVIHHGCIVNCVMPTAHCFTQIENSRLFFSSLNNYLVVFLPGRLLHLLDCSAEHDPCHHIILQGDKTPKFPSWNSTSDEPPLLLYLNKEVSTTMQTGPYAFDVRSGDAYKYNFNREALADIFAGSHMPTTRLAILHLAVIHLRDSALIGKLFEHISHDPASPECLHLLREYLVGATYGAFQRQLEKEAIKLIPFTCVDTFRGHLEKDTDRKRIARISCSFVRDNPIEFQSGKGWKKKRANFWTALVENTKRPPPRLQLKRAPYFENSDQGGESEDEEVEAAPVPGVVHSLYRKLHSKLSGSNESIASQESSKSNSFLDSTDEERSVAEANKQSVTVDRLAAHLQIHLPRETKVKTQNIAIEYVKFQAYYSEALLRLLHQAIGFTQSPFSESLTLRGTTKDVVYFHLVERYYTAVTDLGFPFPAGFRTSMAVLGFRCLDRRMFIQYLDNGVFELKKGFISRLLEDFSGEGENEDYVFQIICRLNHTTAKKILRSWEHPVSSRYISQHLVEDLVAGSVGGVREGAEHSLPRETFQLPASSSEASLDDTDTFRPLVTLMASLRNTVAQTPCDVTESDLTFIEKKALLETQRETVGSLGTIPF